MVDNSRAKTHLDNVRSILSNVNKPNDISSIINKSSLDLLNNLSDNYLFVDNEVIGWLRNVETDLQAVNFWTRVTNQITALDQERGDLLTRGWWGGWGWWWNPFSGRISEIGNLISSLNNINSNYVARHTEFHQLLTNASLFNLRSNISDQNIDVSWPTITWPNIDLSWFHTAGAAPRYLLCDESWKEISNTGWNYKLQIWWAEHTLWNVNFAGDHLDLTHLSINPRITDLPQTLNLSITAYYPVTMGARTINVACNKKFKINLNNWTASVNTETARQREFDNYENSGWGNVISSQLNTKISKINNNPEIWKNDLERKALEAALKYKWGTKYDSLSETQKRLFYRRIRNRFFAPVYLAWWAIDDGNQRYEKMRAWFINGNREWNKDKNITWSASSYKTYIFSHLDEKCDEYILDTLQTYLQVDHRNTNLKAELSSFLQRRDDNRRDEDYPDIQREFTRDRYKMDSWPWSMFHPRDENYMRFFSGSSNSLKNQKVDIYSKIDNLEPVEYDMDLSVSWKNNIEVEIKIKWTNEVIRLESGQPATLVSRIMRDQRIKHGKVRAHIWFNIYKAIIQIAQKKDISLTYRGMAWKSRSNRRTRETRQILINNEWNIVVKQINHLTNTRSENDNIIFDQDTFLNTNEFSNGHTNWVLRDWLEILWYHFNAAMNHLHKQYRKATKRRLSWILSSKSKISLPTSFWTSPIKKILNHKTTTNFDFDTTVNAWWENIKINFTKNKFTIDTKYKKGDKTVDINLQWKDLWKLLNHREWKIRIFDGVERDIVEGVYSSLINTLRNNSKIARTSFWVVDDITWNMYILNEDGKFWMIAREDFKWRNKVNNPFRGLFRNLKKSWSLKKKRLDEIWWKPLDAWEEKELLKNPLLMQKFVKAMNDRMWFFGSVAGLFN